MIPIGLHNEAVYHKISILGGNCISTEWVTNHFHSQGLRIFKIILAFIERINQFHSSFSFSRAVHVSGLGKLLVEQAANAAANQGEGRVRILSC